MGARSGLDAFEKRKELFFPPAWWSNRNYSFTNMLSVKDEFSEVLNVSHFVQSSEHKTCLISIFKNVDNLERVEYKILCACF